VVSIAQRYVEDLVHAGIEPSRTVLIDDAVNLELFNPEQAERGYIQRSFGINGPLLVGLVGRLSPFKRVCELLETIKLLPRDVLSSAEFVLAGEWDQHSPRKPA
jgi:glycosyltransferase involved in cell wall biosynthesis